MLALLTVTITLVTEVRVLEALSAVVAARSVLGWGRRCSATADKLNRSFDQLVQFASIQPDPTAGRAVVDLDALAIGHDEVHALADRAEQGEAFLWKVGGVTGIVCSGAYRFLSARPRRTWPVARRLHQWFTVERLGRNPGHPVPTDRSAG